jgi:hypothetical protein
VGTGLAAISAAATTIPNQCKASVNSESMQVHYKASVPATTAGAISPVTASNGDSGGKGACKSEHIVEHAIMAV